MLGHLLLEVFLNILYNLGHHICNIPCLMYLDDVPLLFLIAQDIGLENGCDGDDLALEVLVKVIIVANVRNLLLLLLHVVETVF